MQRGGHEVKKRKATRAKQVERKLKKGGPGLLIQSQHEKNKDLETRGVQENEIKKNNNRSAFVGQRDIQWAWGFNCSLLTWAFLLGWSLVSAKHNLKCSVWLTILVSFVLGIFIESGGFSFEVRVFV